MRCLLDTCLMLDLLEDRYISPDVEAILDDYDNTFYISSESIKEYINLYHQDKLMLSDQYEQDRDDVFKLVEDSLGLCIKYVTKEHLRKYISLPTIEGHTDPSDRLIVSQAICEGLTLISSDSQFPKYAKLNIGLDLVQNKRHKTKY